MATAYDDRLVGYVTYLLDLSAFAEGTIRHVKGSLSFRPDPERRPANAFAWKITCDSHGVVSVRALRDKRLVLLAHAKFSGVKLSGREQKGTEPTMYQWDAIEETLRTADAERVNSGAPDDDISEPIDAGELAGMRTSGPSVSEAISREIRDEQRVRDRRKNDGPRVLIGLAVVIAACFGVYVAVGHSVRSKSAKTAASEPSPPEPTPSEPSPPAPTPAPAVEPEPAVAPSTEPASPAGPGTLSEVIAATPDLAVDKLASYRVRWSDVDTASQTTLAKVEKDPAAEKGKRVCTEGTLERITKQELAGRPHFTGVLVTKDGDRVAFVVGGSTGELVKRDTARLCGVVTGTSDGATAVFGMFDLPENRNPVVERP